MIFFFRMKCCQYDTKLSQLVSEFTRIVSVLISINFQVLCCCELESILVAGAQQVR